jgi:hypothetical protein
MKHSATTTIHHLPPSLPLSHLCPPSIPLHPPPSTLFSNTSEHEDNLASCK